MNKKIIISTIIIVIIAVIIIVAINTIKGPISGPKINKNNARTLNVGNNKTAGIKAFTMESFTEFIDGKPKPQFSLKEINVKKGDLVRLKITVTSGTHDFKIDEFNVYVDTEELNQEYAVEFTADRTGEFIYYCTKPGHRTNGHWGTLVVTE